MAKTRLNNQVIWFCFVKFAIIRIAYTISELRKAIKYFHSLIWKGGKSCLILQYFFYELIWFHHEVAIKEASSKRCVTCIPSLVFGPTEWYRYSLVRISSYRWQVKRVLTTLSVSIEKKILVHLLINIPEKQGKEMRMRRREKLSR